MSIDNKTNKIEKNSWNTGIHRPNYIPDVVMSANAAMDDNNPVFRPHARHKGQWIFNKFAPKSNCIIIPNNEWTVIEIHHVVVWEENERGKGHGERMMASIREYFPNAHIWVDTWEHSRGFWNKMVQRGYVDSVENEYKWPCMDTTCITCHPTRTTGRRRGQ